VHKNEDARFFSTSFVADTGKSDRESPDLAGSPVSDGDILGGGELAESDDDDRSFIRDMEEEILAMQDIEEDKEDLGKSVCSPLI
jgi:hypothetical protein